MLDARRKLRLLGLPEEATHGARSHAGRWVRLQDESELPPHLRARADRGRLSGWGLVSLLHAAGDRAHHSRASDRRATSARLSIRRESVIDRYHMVIYGLRTISPGNASILLELRPLETQMENYIRDCTACRPGGRWLRRIPLQHARDCAGADRTRRPAELDGASNGIGRD